jgi:hypothetical protein
MITQGAFNLLFRPGLRKDFRDTYQAHPVEYPEFLRTGSMTEPEISATIITGMSRFYERNDGEPVTYDDPKMGPKVVAVDKEFALGFMITRRAVEDDKYGKGNQASKWLANAATKTKEYRAAGFLDDAFTGTNYKGIDGLALLSTAHTCINSSSTWANRPTTEVGLSVTGITALLDLAQLSVDHNGDPMIIDPKNLIIGNNAGDYNRALQIFNSDKEPFTAENQDNALKRRLGKPKITISHYKTSRKSYFMVDPMLNDAWFLTRRELSMDDTFDFDTDAAKYKADMRFAIWFVDPRGWFGANPS